MLGIDLINETKTCDSSNVASDQMRCQGRQTRIAVLYSVPRGGITRYHVVNTRGLGLRCSRHRRVRKVIALPEVSSIFGGQSYQRDIGIRRLSLSVFPRQSMFTKHSRTF